VPHTLGADWEHKIIRGRLSAFAMVAYSAERASPSSSQDSTANPGRRGHEHRDKLGTTPERDGYLGGENDLAAPAKIS